MFVLALAGMHVEEETADQFAILVDFVSGYGFLPNRSIGPVTYLDFEQVLYQRKYA